MKKTDAEMAIFRHKALLLCVNRSINEKTLYEAVCFAWRISKSRAEQAEIILATQHGVIIGAFIAERWLEATTENFSGRKDNPGRFGFIGREAPAAIKAMYLGKSVPGKHQRGAANPVKYTWDKEKEDRP